jgi:dTDP-4-amino-4,6-dideoxygalactose transaminase
MDAIVDVAERHDLLVIEDAAQGVLCRYGDRALGAMGTLGCLSFHETKNVTCGEGGALLVNDGDWIERAEIAHEMGTNRKQFFRGQVDRYTWIDRGSSFLLSDLSAAFLWAQLEEADRITARRLEMWNAYHERFAAAEAAERVRRPVVPDGCRHNAHMYYLLARDRSARDGLIANLGDQGIMAVFHYVPLHSSPAGRLLGRAVGDLRVTDHASDRIVRLPLWVGLSDDDVERITGAVLAAVG